MARPLRIEYPGAYYHIMNRGLSRRAQAQRDRQGAGVREDLIGQFSMFEDEGESGGGEEDSPEGAEY